MIVELVTFKAPPGMDRQAILDDAKKTVPHWRANTELVRKHYGRSEDGYLCGIYIWPSRKAAQRAHNAEWQARVKERSGAPPTIKYFDLFLLVDNEKGKVTEFPETKEEAKASAA
jgi:hypothetical protein